MLFSVLPLLDASIGIIGFWFQCHSHAHLIRHQLWSFWANLDRRWTWSTSLKRCPCDVVFAQNLAISAAIFSAARFMTKTSIKIAWHEPNYMPTSLATSLIVIRRLSKIICFTDTLFSSVVDVLGQLGRASSLTSPRSSLNQLYHNWTCVLLIVDSPNTTVSISNIL